MHSGQRQQRAQYGSADSGIFHQTKVGMAITNARRNHGFGMANQINAHSNPR